MAKQKLQLNYDPISIEKTPENGLLFKLMNITESASDTVSIKVRHLLRELVDYKQGEILVSPAIEAIIRTLIVIDFTMSNEDPMIFKFGKDFADGRERADITVDLTDPSIFKFITSINSGIDGQYFSTLSVKGADVEYEYEFIN